MSVKFSKIDVIKMIRIATFPALGLIDAKLIADKLTGQDGLEVEYFSDIQPILNVCWAINLKVISFNERHELIWTTKPVTDKDLHDISRNRVDN